MRSIAVSGISVISSLGSNIEQTWSNMLNKQSGVSQVTLFPVEDQHNRNACEVKDLKSICIPEVYEKGRATSLLITAIDDALFDAGLEESFLQSARCGLSVGTTMGELNGLSREGAHMKYGPHLLAKNVRDYYELGGPSWTLTNACAAGNFSIAKAMDEIQSGRVDVMIAAGVDALSWVAFTGFSSLRAMSPDFCSPFDKDRKGLILGEGAAVLILESIEHLQKRSRNSKAVLKGYGLNCDAHHITQPDPDAVGAITAMQEALHHAQLSPKDIQYVSSHGTGTRANDSMESKALFKCFGSGITTSSVKGNIGHTLGAASVIEAALSVKIINEKIIPPTANLHQVDPEVEVHVIKDHPANFDGENIISNAYAFGGINSSIIIGK